ncbi:polyprenyl synthetase family protein [Halobacterium yunchengense]|uniref:polyprenyl synthetase family protein n=1 Tax=Halobacterium yunchengense TaxID=3108497 RepID=UPI003008B107
MRAALSEWRPRIDAEIARLLPRTLTADAVAERFGEPQFAYDADALTSALCEPVWDLLDRGGKRWRPVLFLVAAEGFGGDPEELLPYATIPEVLHTGTIIVDDVEDGATLRRGGPAIHRTYGVDVALNAGNALYFVPLKVVTDDPADLPAERRLRAFDMLTHELNRTHLGQGTDIHWHNGDSVAMTEREYLEMSACKTGALGRIAGRLAAIVTGQDEATEAHLADYAESLCIAFQIADDVLDVEHTLDEAGDFGKAFGNDVREGKRTLLVIHAVEHADEADAARLREVLTDDDPSDEDVLDAVGVLRDAGSVEYARERARELAAAARDHLDAVDVRDEQADQLAAFTEFVVDRDA